MTPPITYLFVPGNRPERFPKALATGADAIILDLEDAVAPAVKEQARSEIAQWLAMQPSSSNIVVRINDRQSQWFAADLAWLRTCQIPCVMLPKTESAEDIDVLLTAMPGDGLVIPLIETARGVHNVDTIVGARRVQRLAFGTIDYAVDMSLSGDERGLIYPSSHIALASRCAGLVSPIAGVTLAIDDEPVLLADFAFARALGFGAKMCIHPKQVAVINRAMMPTPAELDWARRVVAAAASGLGAVQVDGRMVDRPVLLKAEAILAHSLKPSAIDADKT